MREVTTSVYRSGRKRHNFYVVVQDGKVTVVDAGGSREFRLLRNGLAQIGLTVDAVEAIVVTHAHDAAQARRSLQRLAALDVRLLLPGHGNPWHGPVVEAVEAALV
jgi:glyoxylase-like metal-dependent hydrolase (beta-lactamase superfamily II)